MIASSAAARIACLAVVLQGTLTISQARAAEPDASPPIPKAPAEEPAPAPLPPIAPPTPAPTAVEAAAPPSSASTEPDFSLTAEDHEPSRVSRLRSPHVEGGLGVAAVSELWSHGRLATGARLDVGLGLGRNFGLVLAEALRFWPGSDISVLAIDVQANLSYGAPYQTRTGFGVVLLGGGERLSASTQRWDGQGGLSTWSTTASLGLRGSLAYQAVNLWIGVDGLWRSDILETGGPTPISIPNVSGLLSIGVFLPALTRKGPFGTAQEDDAARRIPSNH